MTVLAKSWLVLIKNVKSIKSKTKTKQSKNASVSITSTRTLVTSDVFFHPNTLLWASMGSDSLGVTKACLPVFVCVYRCKLSIGFSWKTHSSQMMGLVFPSRSSPLCFFPLQPVGPAWPPPAPAFSPAEPRFPTPAGTWSSAPPPAHCTAAGTRSLQPVGIVGECSGHSYQLHYLRSASPTPITICT